MRSLAVAVEPWQIVRCRLCAACKLGHGHELFCDLACCGQQRRTRLFADHDRACRHVAKVHLEARVGRRRSGASLAAVERGHADPHVGIRIGDTRQLAAHELPQTRRAKRARHGELQRGKGRWQLV